MNRFKFTILLVDDDSAVRRLISLLLRHQSYDVIEAEDGMTALNISRDFDGEIHLLLTDINMPGVDGAVLSETILQERNGIRVLQMSGGCTAEMLETGPCVPFIQKPFQMKTLLSKVEEVIATSPVFLAA